MINALPAVTVSCRCSGQIHQITIGARGRIRVTGHPGVSVRDLIDAATSAHEADQPGAIRCGHIIRRQLVGGYALVPALKAHADQIQQKQIAREAHEKSIDPLLTPLRERINRLATEQIRDAIRSCGYRQSSSKWAGGEHEVRVKDESTRGSFPHADGGSERVWSRNGKWPGTNSWIEVQINPTTWWKSVGHQGAATIDGLFCMYLERPTTALAPRLARAVARGAHIATVLKQGRGFAVVIDEIPVVFDETTGQWHLFK